MNPIYKFTTSVCLSVCDGCFGGVGETGGRLKQRVSEREGGVWKRSQTVKCNRRT